MRLLFCFFVFLMGNLQAMGLVDWDTIAITKAQKTLKIKNYTKKGYLCSGTLPHNGMVRYIVACLMLKTNTVRCAFEFFPDTQELKEIDIKETKDLFPSTLFDMRKTY